MNMAETEANPQIAQLVQLARRELHGDVALSDDAGFARLQARMAQPVGGRWKGWLVSSIALASAAALASVLMFHEHQQHLTFEVAGGGLSANGHVVGKDGTRIHFSDGSEARLSSGTEAQVENLTEHGADVVLTRGSMRVSIAKKPQATWRVAAGPYEVRVTGTAFDVSWSKQAQAFDLRMETGAVIVTGPLALAGIRLTAGQHMFSGEGRLIVEGGGATPSAPAAAPTTLETNPSSDGATAALPTPSTAPHTSAELHTWSKQVAQGHFTAVLDEAEQRGFEHTLAASSLEDLAALADAARYAGRNPLATRVLSAERQRFPGSAAARDAAFFLGRIAEDSGGGAIEWYERYVTENPRGPYASQAFGRKMMLLYKQRGASAAKPVATAYLSQYPNGPYAAAARKIDEESASPPKP